MNEIKVNLENLKQEEREQLMALIEKANKPQSKAWKPKEDEKYWFVMGDGKIVWQIWFENTWDLNYWKIGNCFRTKEEAEFYREKLFVTAELQRFADENNGELKWDGVTKYYFSYDYDEKKLMCDCSYFCQNSSIYFSSYEIAQRAIETIGEERIKKYYLGVTE